MQETEDYTFILILATTSVISVLLITAIVLAHAYHKRKIDSIQTINQLKFDYEKNQLKIQLEIQEATFQNISREIHDNIGLSLTLAKLYLNTLTLNNDTQSNPTIEASIELISTAITDLSDISKGLNSEAICQQGFLQALQIEVEKIKKSKKFKVDLEITGQPIFCESSKELMLYRITQEALNNIIKHSKATSIELILQYDRHNLNLLIKDDGIGINWKEIQELKLTKIMSGLNNMKNRAQLINGKLDIQSSPNNGTSISINVPF